MRHPVLADLAGLVDGTGRAALRAAADPGGTGRGRGRRPGVLPLRRRQRGELPVDGQRAARQRAGGVRRRTARPRPGRRERAVRADRAGGRAGHRRDQPARPDRDPAVGPLVGHRVRRGDGQEGCRSAGRTYGGCSSARNCSATPRARRAAVAELAGRSNAEIAAGLRRRTPTSASWTSGAPSISAPPTGTTAWPRTATSPTPWTPRRAVRLSAPVTVVAAADDPATARARPRPSRLAAAGRPGRPARARRRRSLLPAHPPGRGGTGGARRRRIMAPS